jgi:cytochrome c peroxidase
MGVSRAEVAAWLAGDPQRLARYQDLFGPLRADSPPAAEAMLANVGKALEAFERSIQPPERPWDRFVTQVMAGGVAEALNKDQVQGMRLFLGKAGCATCHAGPLFSDLEFHDTRLPQESASPEPGRFQGIWQVKSDPFNQAGVHSDDREGRMARWLTTLEANALAFGSFKTPSLRFVSLTAPYMHHGSMPDLDSVIAFYNDLSQARPSHHPEPLLQPIHLSPEERAQLRTFLECL